MWYRSYSFLLRVLTGVKLVALLRTPLLSGCKGWDLMLMMNEMGEGSERGIMEDQTE